jgi:hypothetical protein
MAREECRKRFPGTTIGRVGCRYYEQGMDYQQIMDFRKPPGYGSIETS